MFDKNNIITNLTMTPDWRDHLSYGDIVSSRFPLAKEGHTETPKALPGLVLDMHARFASKPFVYRQRGRKPDILCACEQTFGRTWHRTRRQDPPQEVS